MCSTEPLHLYSLTPSSRGDGLGELLHLSRREKRHRHVRLISRSGDGRGACLGLTTCELVAVAPLRRESANDRGFDEAKDGREAGRYLGTSTEYTSRKITSNQSRISICRPPRCPRGNTHQISSTQSRIPLAGGLDSQSSLGPLPELS